MRKSLVGYKDKAQTAAYNKAYRALHGDRLRAEGREYTRQNRERLNAKKRTDYLATREAHRVYNAEYRAAHQEEIRAQRKQRTITAAEREKRRQRGRLFYAQNRDKLIAFSKAYHKEHPEVRKRWADAHPEAVKAIRLRRKHAKRGVGSTLTAQQWAAIKDTFHHRCAYCGRKLKRLTQDHIIPLAKGGTHSMDNVVPACLPCNQKKGTGVPLCPVQPLML
jgi:5-methylcytosine-specific restriction endonuclease McrA